MLFGHFGKQNSKVNGMWLVKLMLFGMINDAEKILTANCDRHMLLDNVFLIYPSAHVHTTVGLLNICNCQCAVLNVSSFGQTTVLLEPVYNDRDLKGEILSEHSMVAFARSNRWMLIAYSFHNMVSSTWQSHGVANIDDLNDWR